MDVTGFTKGVRLGIDVGEVRIGVAICDRAGLLATPLVTVARARNQVGNSISADMSELARLVAAHGVVEIVIGLPVTLAGTEGPAAAQVRSYAEQLAEVVAPVPVTLADERMSTLVATRRLSERGVKARRRREVIDQLAAAEILQGWLDAQRRRA